MGGQRSSTALLLLLLALMLAASSSTAAAVAQRRQPTASRSYYELITVQTIHGAKAKYAMRADDSSMVGFANGKNDWFAIQGSEDIPGHGLVKVNLLGALLKKK